MTAFFVLEELLYQPLYVDAEEYLFRQRRFLENGADNDIQTGNPGLFNFKMQSGSEAFP